MGHLAVSCLQTNYMLVQQVNLHSWIFLFHSKESQMTAKIKELLKIRTTPASAKIIQPQLFILQWKEIYQ